MKTNFIIIILLVHQVLCFSLLAQKVQKEDTAVKMIAPSKIEQPQIKTLELSNHKPVGNNVPHSVNRGSVNPDSGSFSPAAVPGNNNCADAISITIDAACINGTNKEATVQSGESTGCQGSVTKTVWYKFVAASTSHFVEIERTASSGCYLSSAVYSGSCLPSTSLSCEDAANGPNLNIHNLSGLTIGNTYYIQVSYTAGGPCGNNTNANTGADFCIKVGTPVNCSTCNNTCGSLCVYPTQPTVSQVTSTCPPLNLKSRLNAGQSATVCYSFNAVASSFSLQMIVNSVGCGMGGNVQSFNWQLYPSNCTSVIQAGNLSSMNATGLTIGSSYVLCYTWTAACQHNTVYPYIVATSPLPVEFIRFEGKQSDRFIQLSWSTASENDNEYFSVQRSIDGKQFNEIGKVKGGGNSTQVLDYTFDDKNPQRGINYYKIVQHDFDGNTMSSDLIALKYNDSFFATIETNPVRNEMIISVQTESANTMSYTIIDSQGKTVIWDIKPCAKGYNKIVIPVTTLMKGIYYLKLENKSGTTWKKFMKA